MKSPFSKYIFTCKNCGNESKCRLDSYSKKRLLMINGGKPFVDQRCWICGHDANYHFDRLYSKSKVWPILVIWVLALGVSYFFGMALYERFGDLEGRSDDKLYALAIAFIAPLALGGLIAIQVARFSSKFNQEASELM